MIELRNVNKSFGQLSVLANINLAIQRGEFVSIVGPSGCGKTTLLKIVGGLISPSSGDVIIDSRPASVARAEGSFGFVFQKPVLLPWRNLRQNVELPLELLGRNGKSGAKTEEILRTVGLQGFEDAMPRELSGGMQQRASLARALVFSPMALLMDEPFAGADELLRDRLDLDLTELTQRLQQTVLFVTHSIPEAVLVSTSVVVLSSRPGRLKEVIPIDLDWPRAQYRGSRQHHDLVQRVRHILET